jgi:xanthine dehydrogenase accessory factor
MTRNDLLDMSRELAARGTAYALVTVVRAVAPTSAYLGAQAIVLVDGTLHGWIGGGCAMSVAIGAAQEAIAAGEPRLVRISNDRIQSDADIEQHAMSCASNDTVELFIQPGSARSALCVLGATPAADEARFLAGRLSIGLADAPGEALIVLVATQGQGDEDALELALRSPATHVLMIASRRKAERLRTAMRMRGIDESRLARLAAPAGPDAGARTPAEIAMVSMVGVLALLRGRSHSCDHVASPPAAGRARDAQQPQPAIAAGTTTAQERFVNPVCGMAISTADPKHVEAYEGVDYYFCCDGCWTTFLREPAKYAAIHRAAITPAPA